MGTLQRPLCDCPGVSLRDVLSGLDGGKGRAVGPRKGRLWVEGQTAGLRKLSGSQPFLRPLPLVGQTSRAHGHLRCWSGRAAYWAAGHPEQRWCGPSRGPWELFLVARADSQILLTISGTRRLP